MKTSDTTKENPSSNVTLENSKKYSQIRIKKMCFPEGVWMGWKNILYSLNLVPRASYLFDIGKAATPKLIEEELLQWIYMMNDQHFPVSVKILSKKAKILISQHQPDFKASHGWYAKFLQRNDLSLRKRTSLSQKLPR